MLSRSNEDGWQFRFGDRSCRVGRQGRDGVMIILSPAAGTG